MLGRGIDQILPHPSDPMLKESYVHDARDYVALAEAENGASPDRLISLTCVEMLWLNLSVSVLISGSLI